MSEGANSFQENIGDIYYKKETMRADKKQYLALYIL